MWTGLRPTVIRCAFSGDDNADTGLTRVGGGADVEPAGGIHARAPVSGEVLGAVGDVSGTAERPRPGNERFDIVTNVPLH